MILKITGRNGYEGEDDDSKTHHLVNIQHVFNAGDEDVDVDVADADCFNNSCFAQSLAFMWIDCPDEPKLCTCSWLFSESMRRYYEDIDSICPYSLNVTSDSSQ